MLHPHEWDDDLHRQAIHTAFDIWMTCYMTGNANAQQTARWRNELRRLTEHAAQRKRVHDEQERIRCEFELALDGGLAEAV